jgi:hypothetical protein
VSWSNCKLRHSRIVLPSSIFAPFSTKWFSHALAVFWITAVLTTPTTPRPNIWKRWKGFLCGARSLLRLAAVGVPVHVVYPPAGLVISGLGAPTVFVMVHPRICLQFTHSQLPLLTLLILHHVCLARHAPKAPPSPKPRLFAHTCFPHCHRTRFFLV